MSPGRASDRIFRDSRTHAHHFEAIRAVYHEEDEVRDLGYVNHGVEVIVALDEGNAFLLSANDGDGPLYVVEGLLRVASDEGLHKRGLPDAGRADNCDDGGRGLVIGCAVDEGDMEACLVTLCSAASLSVCSPARLGGECLG